MHFHSPCHWLEGLCSLLKQFLAYLCFFTGNEQIFYLPFILCFLASRKNVKRIFVLCYCIVCKAFYSTTDTIAWAFAIVHFKVIPIGLASEFVFVGTDNLEHTLIPELALWRISPTESLTDFKNQFFHIRQKFLQKGIICTG